MSNLSNYIKSLSPAAEFWIVMAAAFAVPIIDSQLALMGTDGTPALEPGDLRRLVVQEAVVLAGLGWFLSVRGWNFAGFTAYPSRADCVLGVLLAIAFLLVWTVLSIPLRYIFPAGLTPAEPAAWAPGLDWPTLLAVSIFNPLFEELLVCGYIISTLRERQGLGLAVVMSLAVRVAYHTYQGAEGVLTAGLLGAFCSFWFVRTERLWSLIVAHGILDFLALVGSTWV